VLITDQPSSSATTITLLSHSLQWPSKSLIYASKTLFDIKMLNLEEKSANGVG
jgi:hypothetical protein